MKKTILGFSLLLTLVSCAREETIDDLAHRVFKLAATQVRIMDGLLEENECPRSLNPDGSLMKSTIWWWCSGFYPGTVWLAYEYTGEESLMDIALRHTVKLDSIRFRTNDHDVGFQLNCSYGNAFRLTGREDFKSVLHDGAHSFATRLNPTIGCTRSWDYDGRPWDFPVIIDNMMNLELLLKVGQMYAEPDLCNVAVSHADVTMRNHFREDGSSWHLVDYDPVTGNVNKKQTVQGYSDDSAWSRGQSWGLYGFTMMYQYTRDEKYLRHAVKVADYLLPRLPEDGVPYWDYDDPDIPDAPRDASAAAIMASALVSLSELVEVERSGKYLSAAENIVRTLASEEYLAEEGTNCGFILKHGVGFLKAGSEVDVPLTYSDYYFLEAIMKLSK
jgi:rhamnogalacturonyl hydrolase YesR